MEKEIRELIAALGLDALRATQIARMRRDILRRAPLRSTNWLK